MQQEINVKVSANGWDRVCQVYTELRERKFALSFLTPLEASGILEQLVWPQYIQRYCGCDNEAWSFLDVSDDGRSDEPVEMTDVAEEEICQHSVGDPPTNGRPVSQSEAQNESRNHPRNGAFELKVWTVVISTLFNEKFRQRVDVWEALNLGGLVASSLEVKETTLRAFRLFFYSSWFLYLRAGRFVLSIKEKAGLLLSFIHIYQSLEQQIVRSVCMPLCGLPSWTYLGSRQVKQLLAARRELKPMWNAIQRKYKSIASTHGPEMDFDSPGLTLVDRFRLLDRDALRLSIADFTELVERTLSKRLPEDVLVSEGLADVDETLFAVNEDLGTYNNQTSTKPNRVVATNLAEMPDEEFRSENPLEVTGDELLLCERFLEFLIDLLSQLPTRRIARPVVSSFQVTTRLRRSRFYRFRECALVRRLNAILSGFEAFEIDDDSGSPLDNKRLEIRHYGHLKELQMLLFEHFSDEPRLKEAALRPIAKLDSAPALRALLMPLPVTTLLQLCDALRLVDALQFARMALGPLVSAPSGDDAISMGRLRADGCVVPSVENVETQKGSKEYEAGRSLLIEVIVRHLARRRNQLDAINRLPLYPIETLIWDPNMIPMEHYRGDFSLALPKLNLQFLTVRDYLIRNFHLFRLEAAYGIREDLEDAVWRMKPIVSGAALPPITGRLASPVTGLLPSPASDLLPPIASTAAALLAADTGAETRFTGQSKMACPIDNFSIIQVKPPALGSDVPAEVRGEILVDLRRVPKETRSDWDSLRQFDVLFLLAVRVPPKRFEGRPQDLTSAAEFPEKFGVLGVRGCEVVEVLDEEGTAISEPSGSGAGAALREPFGDVRTFRVLLDPFQYQTDLADLAEGAQQGESRLDVYSAVNLVVRRKPAENNFKAVLQTIRQLMNDVENAVIPQWFHELFLGYGDPDGAKYFNLPNEVTNVDFADTFLDRHHIEESFVEVVVKDLQSSDSNADDNDRSELVAPLEKPLCRISFTGPNLRETDRGKTRIFDSAAVEWYRTEARGPYPQCEMRMNKIRFTPLQVEAIRSGVNPGLTLIVGPPGTGKTDTAVQIAHLLHRNFPEERILIIAHSNQALNDLFEKIADLDIDERYLLRLGMGEKELRVSTGRNIVAGQKKDFSKWGRVNYMLQRRLDFLERVQRFAQSLRVVGDFASSCEAAIQFYRFHILSRIQRFRRHVEEAGPSGRRLRVLLCETREQDGESNKAALRVLRPAAPIRGTVERAEQEMLADQQVEREQNEILETLEKIDDDACIAFYEGRRSVPDVLFPFAEFFSDVEGGLFKGDGPPQFERDLNIAEACFRWLHEMFKEIEECRAFELLRTLHDRTNFLITRHAKVIAMTCTHAALVRQQFLDMRFRYDSLIMEEAGQMMEVETFIPMVLQKAETEGTSRLKRIVLLGDHHQLPPVVKNRGFQQYARLDQSMFARLIRLQVPYVQLDRQGRCRTSLRQLFSWRYQSPPLGDLPCVLEASAYSLANPGLCFEYQFVDTPDYEGRGEHCPLPYFYQNRGEAEFAVALFMYLRLVGYPAESIAMLTTYNGQKTLLQQVIQQSHSFWSDHIALLASAALAHIYLADVILSLVRTRAVGHLRDVRRLVVAVSRARLGLYVFGRLNLFGSCAELAPTFEQFIQRPTKLALNLSETRFVTRRPLGDCGDVTLVDDVYGLWEVVQRKALETVAAFKPAPPPPPSSMDTDLSPVCSSKD